MTTHKHNSENAGSNPRDQSHSRPHFLKTIHLDWRFWVVVILMITLVGVYVITNNLSLRPQTQTGPTGPESTLP